MTKELKNILHKDPSHDPLALVKNYLDKNKGLYFYFRTSCIRMQARFAQLMDHSDMPKVFLHGNPHLDNFVKTDKGAAMIDFDRSRFGPYAWDIVRLLSSIALKKAGPDKKFLSDIVIDYFYEGYFRSFSNDNLPFKQPTHLENIHPQKWQRTINDYLKSNNGWATKLKQGSISTENPALNGSLMSYLESRNELSLMEEYKIEKAAQALGTLQNKRFLILLASKADKKADRILLDLKTVYKDPDNEWYYNPYEHHGLRMIKAAEIYAPDIEERLGYATFEGEQYWGRAIPSFSYKIKTKLNETLQLDIAYSVGTQLGQAHRKSLVSAEPGQLTGHLTKNYKNYIEIAGQLSREIKEAHKDYVAGLKKSEDIKTLAKVK